LGSRARIHQAGAVPTVCIDPWGFEHLTFWLCGARDSSSVLGKG
jgi:hypothetical protein